jgi:hypothetical protein
MLGESDRPDAPFLDGQSQAGTTSPYAKIGENPNEALTLAINLIIVSQTEKACRSPRKLLFFSNA